MYNLQPFTKTLKQWGKGGWGCFSNEGCFCDALCRRDNKIISDREERFLWVTEVRSWMKF